MAVKICIIGAAGRMGKNIAEAWIKADMSGYKMISVGIYRGKCLFFCYLFCKFKA